MAVVAVTDVPERQRYELHVDGRLAGFAEYRFGEDRRFFTHTEVLPEFEGRGLGGTLARGALDLASVSGESIVPACPFIASYVDRHPEYQDLVDHELLARLLAG